MFTTSSHTCSPIFLLTSYIRLFSTFMFLLNPLFLFIVWRSTYIFHIIWWLILELRDFIFLIWWFTIGCFFLKLFFLEFIIRSWFRWRTRFILRNFHFLLTLVVTHYFPKLFLFLLVSFTPTRNFLPNLVLISVPFLLFPMRNLSTNRLRTFMERHLTLKLF